MKRHLRELARGTWENWRPVRYNVISLSLFLSLLGVALWLAGRSKWAVLPLFAVGFGGWGITWYYFVYVEGYRSARTLGFGLAHTPPLLLALYLWAAA